MKSYSKQIGSYYPNENNYNSYHSNDQTQNTAHTDNNK